MDLKVLRLRALTMFFCGAIVRPGRESLRNFKRVMGGGVALEVDSQTFSPNCSSQATPIFSICRRRFAEGTTDPDHRECCWNLPSIWTQDAASRSEMDLQALQFFRSAGADLLRGPRIQITESAAGTCRRSGRSNLHPDRQRRILCVQTGGICGSCT